VADRNALLDRRSLFPDPPRDRSIIMAASVAVRKMEPRRRASMSHRLACHMHDNDEPVARAKFEKTDHIPIGAQSGSGIVNLP